MTAPTIPTPLAVAVVLIGAALAASKISLDLQEQNRKLREPGHVDWYPEDEPKAAPEEDSKGGAEDNPQESTTAVADPEPQPDLAWLAGFPHCQDDLDFSEEGHRRSRSTYPYPGWEKLKDTEAEIVGTQDTANTQSDSKWEDIRREEIEKVKARETDTAHPDTDDSQVTTPKEAEDFVEFMFEEERVAAGEDLPREDISSVSCSESKERGRGSTGDGGRDSSPDFGGVNDWWN